MFNFLEQKKSIITVFLITIVSFSIAVLINIERYETNLEKSQVNSLSLISGDEPGLLILTSDLIYHHSFFIEKYFQDKNDTRLNLPQDFYKNPSLWISYQRDDGHYITLKEPGLAYILIPGYFLGGLFGAMITMTVISSLISVTIYKFCTKISNSKMGFVTSIVFSFATLIFTYSNQIYSDVLISLFLIVILYFIFTKSQSSFYMCITGILMGFGVFIKTPFIIIDIILIPIILFLTIKKKIPSRSFFAFLIFFSLFTVFALVHNLYIYHSIIGSKNSQDAISILFMGKSSGGTFSYNLQSYRFDAVIESLFGRFHGILIYSPILLLSFIGIGSLWNKNRTLFITVALISAGIFSGYIYLNPDSIVLGGDPPFRYFLPIIPLLSIPFSLGIQEFGKRIIYRISFILSFSIGFSFSVIFGYDRLLSIDSSIWKSIVVTSVYHGIDLGFPVLGPSYGMLGEVFPPKPLDEFNMMFIGIMTIFISISIIISFLGIKNKGNTKFPEKNPY